MMISVVIPTFQRPERLARCLECIEAQTLPRAAFEVIVTDDGPYEWAQGMLEGDFPWVGWTHGPRRGPAANRNHGASHARGDWIVFVDDDCEPSIGWLAAIAAQNDVDVIEGKTVCPSERDTPFQERVENLRGGNYWSCNLAVRRAVFERLGGFDEDFRDAGGEDMEFAWRIAGNKLRTRFLTAALVTHPARPVTWKQLWWRTWLIRWMSLYWIKTGQSVPLHANYFQVIARLVEREIAGLLRTSAHYFLRFDRRLWRTKLFHQFWRWLTFPLVLPYLMFWEIRFRNMLRKRAREVKK
jgi:GT2 family glycosyltransferase